MDLTNSQRITKLAGNLLSNPRLILPYLRMSIFSQKLPIDYGVPWWSFHAIERADSLLKGKRIFEYGTGGSTLRYAKIATQVVSVEDNSEWMSIVLDRLANENITNVDIRLFPFDFKNPVGFENSDYINAVDGDTWDVVIIDGQDWSFKQRISCFRKVEPIMSKGSIIIVDDFWRYEELLKSNKAKSVEVYESVGPASIGVTSTAFFFY